MKYFLPIILLFFTSLPAHQQSAAKQVSTQQFSGEVTSFLGREMAAHVKPCCRSEVTADIQKPFLAISESGCDYAGDKHHSQYRPYSEYSQINQLITPICDFSWK